MIGVDEDAPRVGNVREVVLKGGGTVFENGGETSTQTPASSTTTTPTASRTRPTATTATAAIKRAAMEVYDNAIDENGEGLADKRKRAATKLTLGKRRGATWIANG